MSKRHKHTRTPITLLELLEEQVDVRRLIDKIEFSESSLMEAAFNQPKLFWESGRLRVQQMQKRAMLETKIDLERSLSGLKIRGKTDSKGKKKYSEGGVKERIILSSTVKELTKLLDKAQLEEELGKNLVDAYRMRRDVLRIVIDAGKISVHARELEMLKGGKRLGRMVKQLRNTWKNNEYEED